MFFTVTMTLSGGIVECERVYVVFSGLSGVFEWLMSI